MISSRALVVLGVLAIAFVGCAKNESDDDAASESEVRSASHRSKLQRLSNVDALARLYVGHALKSDELLALGTKSEGAVVDALTSRADFRERYTARLADFHIANGKAPTSEIVDPQKPILDAFGGKKIDADRFARWLVETLAPRVARDLIAKNEATLSQMTYRELLDAIRKGAQQR